MNESEIIELRSEKVRNIIGQIPPRIIRTGITTIFIIIIGILTGTYFFEYEYIIKTSATVLQQNDTTIIIVKIPANEIDKVKLGHKIILDFGNIPYLYNEKFETEIQIIPNKLEIYENGGFYLAVIKTSKSIISLKEKELEINELISVNAEIITGKISFFDKITEPFKSLF